MQRPLLIITAVMLAVVVGCMPTESGVDPAAGDMFDAVLSVTATVPPQTENPPQAADNPDAVESSQSESASIDFSGNVTGNGNYKLYDLGSGVRGDAWTVSAESVTAGAFVVVLLDADQNLIMRQYMSYSRSLHHVLREDTGELYLGIMPPSGGRGGTYHLKAVLTSNVVVPAPTSQVVYLNFGAGNNITVHNRDSISFAPFDGAMVGDDYAGFTSEIKATILQEMRADYASYNVTILSSDEGPPPNGPYSTIHFGGRESGLLGLADEVDNYNQHVTQKAVVYVENFEPYRTMRLAPDEMGVMIANVASHELGHLLGLYHTVNHEDLMDTTGSAWDLAENQGFVGGELEETVFATGYENGARLLAQSVGLNHDAAKAAPQAKSAKSARYKAIRSFAEQEIAAGCGTCLHLDE